MSCTSRRLAGRRLALQACLLLMTPAVARAAGANLLNVSDDVSREFYKDFNAAFVVHWKKGTGEDLTISPSHGGSSRQARRLADGLEADVITMNQANDIDILFERGPLIRVRKGNPKGIKDGADRARPGVSVVIPNPTTSDAKAFRRLSLFTGDEVLGGWKKAQADHFNDGAGDDPIIAVAKKR